jgi:hypothetical protein
MSLWHAGIDTPSLVPGAHVKVFSPHRVVRVVTADKMSIETPAGDRWDALVLDRTGGDLTLVLTDGRAVKLSMVSDESISLPHPGQEFSQQRWIVN